MVVDLKDTDPDDVFSSVPYEKGSCFLTYLERILGGPGEKVVLMTEEKIVNKHEIDKLGWNFSKIIVVFFTLIADVFEPFLKSYLKKFQYETVTIKEWRHYLEEYFHDKVRGCTCKV